MNVTCYYTHFLKKQAIMIRFFILVCIASYVRAQFSKPGACPNVEVQKEFDTAKYAGKWYEIEKSNVFYEVGLRCITSEYMDRNGELEVVNRGVFQITNIPWTARGTASPANAEEPAKLVLRWRGIPIPANYWVLDTDYDQYSVVWSCTNLFLGLVHEENLFVLSRTPLLDITTRQNIYTNLDKLGIDRSRLQVTDQNNCNT